MLYEKIGVTEESSNQKGEMINLHQDIELKETIIA